MWVQCMYLREEDFLCDYLGTVEAVLPQLGGWQPNYSCNDRERERRRLAFAHGTQAELVFEEAVIVHDRNGFAALEIHLRSSDRLLIVQLRWDEGKTIVTTRLDCPCERDGRPRH